MSYLTTYTPEQLEDLILPCIGSTPVTAVTLFSHHFTRPFSIVHDQIFKILDDDSIKLSAIAAPRGFGKTTTVALGFIARKILFREVHYIVYISSTVTEAVAKVKTLARELQENELIKELFGDLKGVKWAEGTGEIELSDENGPFCYIQAKGAGSQVRGLKWGQYRPDIFLIDDLEDAEAVLNEELRKKLKEWFFADVIGAMDQACTGTTRVFMIGTLLHEDSLLANLIDEGDEEEDFSLEENLRALLAKEQFVTLRLEACDDRFHSVWPEYLSDDALKAKALAYEKRGLLDVFYREWRNIVIAKSTANFQKEKFRYYDDSWEDFIKSEKIIIVDPAKTANPKAAFTAVICVGFNPVRNRIYFIDCVNKRMLPEETFKTATDMADRWCTYTIGADVTGLGEYFEYPFKQHIQKLKRFYQLIPLKLTKPKEIRVGGMVPFYTAGHIWHNPDPAVRLALETQLLSYPRPKYWDVMDCFANFIPMFNLGERFFTQDFEDDTGKTEAQMLEDLRKEDLEENKDYNMLWRPV